MLHVAYIIATSGMVTFHFISGKMVHMTVLGDSLFYITAFFIGGKETGIFYKDYGHNCSRGRGKGSRLKFRL